MFNKVHLSKLGKECTTEDYEKYVRKLERDSVEYRKLLVKHIDVRLKKLLRPDVGFDTNNYALKQAARNNAAYYLNLVKEVIDE